LEDTPVRKLIAAVALLSLAGCAGYNAQKYHAISPYPPTPTALEAFNVCNHATWNQFLAEDTVSYAAAGVFGLMASSDRKQAAMATCMEEHGYAAN
jgi:hypothetical protein